ncbi:uncharacterized protein TNCV_4583651 [Trichonephila clavipes]|nr:uncharacterized protein TNCV_4583651 [Trichonephila clavipes]
MPSLRDGNAIETLLMTAQINTDLVNHPVPLPTETSTSLVRVGTDACKSIINSILRYKDYDSHKNAHKDFQRRHIKACYNCRQSLNRKSIQNLSKYNGIVYPEIPGHLSTLDLVSERLISPRILFTQIRRLRHVLGQFGILGTSKSSNDPNPCDPERKTSSENSDSVYKFSQEPQPFNQKELSDLVRDLNFPKEASEILASRLKEKNLLTPETNITFYRTREKNLSPFFSQEKDLVFCNDFGGLLQQMGLKKYQPIDWRLFIDSSKRSLKCVLLNNGNKYGSIPIAHSVTLKEEYANIAKVMETIKYQDHKWFNCVDLKMVNFLLGQ